MILFNLFKSLSFDILNARKCLFTSPLFKQTTSSIEQANLDIFYKEAMILYFQDQALTQSQIVYFLYNKTTFDRQL